jgi:hypothetical protein
LIVVDGQLPFRKTLQKKNILLGIEKEAPLLEGFSFPQVELNI